MSNTTPQIVHRARDAAERGQSVLILVTSRRQEEDLRRELPKGVRFSMRPVESADPPFDLVLDDR